MICNEFIDYNYCVKKKKNKPYKLEHGLYIQPGLNFGGYFQRPWDPVL